MHIIDSDAIFSNSFHSVWIYCRIDEYESNDIMHPFLDNFYQ